MLIQLTTTSSSAVIPMRGDRIVGTGPSSPMRRAGPRASSTLRPSLAERVSQGLSTSELRLRLRPTGF